jgi:4-hydroxy-tetrahydrodipicolinate reductase
MNIALAGYGKMGHEVEAVAKTRGHEVVVTFDIDRPLSPESIRSLKPDVIIDFTQPDAVMTNVRVATKAGLPIVIGTTGWDGEISKVEKMVAEAGTACVFASNFSIGVNIFLKIVADASKLLHGADYDVYITEAHHNTKKDFPSGTALRISEAVLSGFKSKSKVVSQLKQGEAPAKDSILVSSIRAGSITGKHTVGFDSEVDSIELTHEAKSRRGFALGAVRAAEWVVGKKGMYRFEDNLTEIVGTKK